MIGRLGQAVWAQWDELRHAAAVMGTLFVVAVRPRYWGRTVRSAFARQLISSGVESVPFVLILAGLVGISVVQQLNVWAGKLGQSQTLGQLLVLVVARELGPLFANFVLIVRGGSAITTELGIMKVGGEVRVLEAQGIEPLLFLVMPRVLAMAVAAFCLTVIFVLMAFASGYGFGVFIGQANADPAVFLNGVFRAVHPYDAIGFLVKCLLPALLTAVICSIEGLSVEGGAAAVPLAAQRALSRSLAALFVTSVGISLLTYS